MTDEFCLKMRDFHVTFMALLHAVNLRHVTNGFASLPKEGVLRIFSPWKIRRLRSGLNSRTWVPLDHRSRLKLDLRRICGNVTTVQGDGCLYRKSLGQNGSILYSVFAFISLKVYWPLYFALFFGSVLQMDSILKFYRVNVQPDLASKAVVNRLPAHFH